MNRRSVLKVVLGTSALGLGRLAWPGTAGAFPKDGPPRKPRPPGAGALVMLDPGHGGRDPGAIGGRGTLEKDVTLDICLSIAGVLAAERGVRVRLTREKDEFLPLAERVERARAAAADLFVSIHADSAPNREARGLSAYTLSEKGSDDFARALAHQENLADRFGGIDISRAAPEVAAILMDLRARHTRDAALYAKDRIVEGVEDRLRTLENPKRSANFAVLKAPDVPSVLIETGFLSNRQDEELLRDPAHRARIAAVLARELSSVVREAPFA